jgi:hypothetical protein
MTSGVRNGKARVEVEGGREENWESCDVEGQGQEGSRELSIFNGNGERRVSRASAGLFGE